MNDVPDYNRPWGLDEEGTVFREPDYEDDMEVKRKSEEGFFDDIEGADNGTD